MRNSQVGGATELAVSASLQAAHADGATATNVPRSRMQPCMMELPATVQIPSESLLFLDSTLARLMTSTLASARFCESVALQFASERDSIAQTQDVLRGMVQEATGVDMAEHMAQRG